MNLALLSIWNYFERPSDVGTLVKIRLLERATSQSLLERNSHLGLRFSSHYPHVVLAWNLRILLGLANSILPTIQPYILSPRQTCLLDGKRRFYDLNFHSNSSGQSTGTIFERV